MALKKEDWRDDTVFRKQVVCLWMLDNTLKEIAKQLHTTRKAVERVVHDYYSDEEEDESKRYDPICLSDFSPLTRARVHQAILNDNW